MKISALLDRIRFSDDTLRPYPSFPILYFYLTGTLALGLWEFEHLSQSSALGLFILLIAAGILIFPGSLLNKAIPVLLGISITSIYIWAPWRTYTNFLPRDEVYAEIKAVLADDSLTSDPSLEWLRPRRNLKLNLTGIRLSQFEDWQKCRGEIILVNPDDTLRYGQAIHAKGALLKPFRTDLPGGFNYRNHLKTSGILHVFRAEETRILRSEPEGWRRVTANLVTLRESLLERILRQIDDTNNEKILAAMTLGYRRGLSSADKKTFLHSGMIHLFAISGLHVGILFTILLILLSVCRISFSSRYLLAPLFLLIYVVATGGAPSALRAWLMISVWSVGRGLKIPVVAINTLLFSALVLLIFNPFYIFQSGFQYSYIVVLCLVKGWNKGRAILEYLGEERRWQVRPRWSPVYQLRQIVLAGIISMTAAWLGGLALTAYHNSLFLPTSIITNLFVGVQAWVIISLAVVKSFTGLLVGSWPDMVVAKLLGMNLSALMLLAKIGSTFGAGITVAKPSILWMIFYHVLLVVVLFRNTTLRLNLLFLCLLLTYVAFGFFFANPLDRKPEVTVIVPTSSLVPLIIISPSNSVNEPIIFNSGTRAMGYELASYMRSVGVNTIDKLVVVDNRSSYTGGSRSIMDSFPVRTLAVMARDRRGLDSLRQQHWENKSKWRVYYRDKGIRLDNCAVTKEIRAGVTEYRIQVVIDDLWELNIGVRTTPGQETLVSVERRQLINETVENDEWRFIYSNKHELKTF